MSKPAPALEHCMVCAAPLQYGEAVRAVRCHCCGNPGEALITCPEGHYVCDGCHSAGTMELLPRLAGQVRRSSPEEILEELLALPRLPMHGTEHHPMAGLALLIAARKGGRELSEGWMAEMLRRALQVPGGSCGYLGACGAGVSVGVAVSLLAGATPVKGPQRGLANRATARALAGLGDDHPRCCKRALRRAVSEGRHFLATEMGLALPAPAGPIRCRDIHRNRECPGAACPYCPGDDA